MFNHSLMTRVGSLAMMAFAVQGCAMSYANRNFEGTIAEADVSRFGGKIEAWIANDFAAESRNLWANGYELVGYSKLTSPLQPMLAVLNAKTAARKNGASHVMLAPPQNARIGQFHHLFTYWRKADPAEMLFGAQYVDTPSEGLAIAGCDVNLVKISNVVTGSPADQMGLQTGDQIVSVDEVPINTARQMDDVLGLARGLEVEVRYIRGDESRVAVGTLGSLPEGYGALKEKLDPVGIGLVEARLNDGDRKAYGRKEGVFVTSIELDGYGCEAGLRYGDMIISVGGKPVKDARDFQKQIDRSDGRKVDVKVLRVATEKTLSLDFTPEGKEIADGFRRRDIVESHGAVPPWTLDEGGDYSFLAGAVLLTNALAASYRSYQEAERARMDEFNRQRAAYASSAGTTVYEDRRGGWVVETANGTQRVDRQTAEMLQSNPGFTVASTSRRGSGTFAVYDKFDNVVYKGNANPVQMIIPPISSADVSNIQWKIGEDFAIRKQLGQTFYQQARIEAPIANTGMYSSNAQYYSNGPYVGGNPNQGSKGVMASSSQGRRGSVPLNLPDMWSFPDLIGN